MNSLLVTAGALLAQESTTIEAGKLEAWQIALIVIAALGALCLLLIILKAKEAGSTEDKPE